MADTFRILSQTQATAIRPAGGFQQVMRITAETRAHGVVFSVDVPVSNYSDTSYVHDLLDARSREIDAVQRL